MSSPLNGKHYIKAKQAMMRTMLVAGGRAQKSHTWQHKRVQLRHTCSHQSWIVVVDVLSVFNTWPQYESAQYQFSCVCQFFVGGK